MTTDLNLTELELRAIGAELNLADGHPRQDLTKSQCDVVAQFPDLFWFSRQQIFSEIERKAQTAFLTALGQHMAPVQAGRVYSVYSSSVATMVLANALRGHRVAMLHPTFDNIHAILSKVVPVMSMSESEIAEIRFSDEVDKQATCLFITTPNNPTGWVLTQSALEGLCCYCLRKGKVLCLDVSFRGFDIRAQFDHYAVLERTGVEYVLVEDTGKLWPLQELKLGFLAVSEGFREKVHHCLSDVLLTVSPFLLQLVEVFSLDGAAGGFERLHALIAENRKMIVDALDGFEDIKVPDCDARISVCRLQLPTSLQAEKAYKFLTSRGVHVLPCRQFYWERPEDGARLIRIALARNKKVVAEFLSQFSMVLPNIRETRASGR
ncbi:MULTISPECIES: aminotransferase class I/II-fold pyridoxal phosphate-dependent enzyme [unclassified Variovorax]|uniref:aminotransferase class I/II-fold pyridoxal phosphate-dependent enzyme n=1 Tax=unclassified Variovorax TaxID=663243 RepID=UPI001BD6DC17|nr:MULTISPECIES: aminotransferase class I/II-fold pyridoxal phosphate-dependent enzyme [unclassified Variovorax]